MNVYTLKINKKYVGKEVPFDRVYLAEYDDVGAYDELFRYALVMPMTAELAKTLRDYARPDEFYNRTFERDDDDNAAQGVSESEWSDFLSKEWVVAIPILSKYAKDALAVPRYLTTPGWQAAKKGRVKPSPFSEYTYLQTPERKIRPVCALCPRYILQQEGQCSLGQRVCYETLPLGFNDYYTEGLNAPEAPENEKEIEESKVVNDARVQ